MKNPARFLFVSCIVVYFVCFTGLVFGDSIEVVEKNSDSTEIKKTEIILDDISKQAFKEEDAGVVLSFEGLDRYYFEKPFIGKEDGQIKMMSSSQVRERLDNYKGDLELAVVIMSEQWALQYQEQKAADIKQIEDMFKGYGFEKVVFKQACGDCDQMSIIK